MLWICVENSVYNAKTFPLLLSSAYIESEQILTIYLRITRTHHNLGEKSAESEAETILLSGHPYQDQLLLQM